MPIAVVTTGGTLIWVHSDHLGTPVVMTNASGATIPQPGGYTTPAFSGQSRTLYDLYYNRYRDYDPTTGRYIQADPIGLAGGQSPYSYAMGNPLRYSDPSGLAVWPTSLDPSGFGPPMLHPNKPTRPFDWTRPMPTMLLAPKQPCPEEKPPPPPTDWCGSSVSKTEWVPDQPLGYNISHSCKVHDLCYSGTSSTSRRQCDANLGAMSFLQCLSQGGDLSVCAFIGDTYFLGVRLGGRESYQGKGSAE
jgi:RHS repeat-associated protein